MHVTVPQVINDHGALGDKALTEPVTITKNGRAVLIAAEHAHLDEELGDWQSS